MAFRSVIAAYPNSNREIEVLKIAFSGDPSLDTYNILCDHFREENADSEHNKIILKMEQELNDAKKESVQQQKVVEKLRKQQKTIELTLNKYPIEKSDIQTESDISKEQLIQGKRKIEQLQGIIKDKQEAIKGLKTRISQESKNCENQEQVEEERSEIDFDKTIHIIPKITVPEYSKEFIKCLETEEPAIAKKALESITGFTINDLKIMKQTKRIKSIENYYSIRIGIHHRLLVEYVQNSTPKAQYLIHRKDLEKYIKKIQQSK